MSAQSQKNSLKPLTSSQRASLAKAPAWRENGKGSPMIEPLFGGKLSALLASYDPATLSWRTSQACLPFLGAETLAPYSGPWPKSGTMRNGQLYRLLNSERPTSESVYLSSELLPTPTTCANMLCPDTQKWRAARNLPASSIGKKPNPLWLNWLMGFPTGWTDYEP